MLTIKKISIHLLATALFILTLTLSVAYPSSLENRAAWFLDRIHTPEGMESLPASKKSVIIAVVDDGVRISHQDLKDFIWRNPKEIPGNHIDDDGNGYVDDINGWDVSDNNNTVAPPIERLKEYAHGTHVAGIIAQIARRAYGDRAQDFVRILPVKALSDQADRTYLKEGYKGVEYAIRAGADIVVCAWGVNTLSADETRILREADDKDVLIVASAGNFPQERAQYPAGFESVLAVAALNEKGEKTKESNFGSFVDLSAPGVDISSVGVLSDTASEVKKGTSPAAAMVAMAAGIVKLQHPLYSAQKVTACLKSSAEPIDTINPRYASKLGVGQLHVELAAACTLFEKETKSQNELMTAQGYLHFNRSEGKATTWTIEPLGAISGFRFRLLYDKGPPEQGTLRFYSGHSGQRREIASYPITNFPGEVYVPGQAAYVTYEAVETQQDVEWLLTYKADTINLSKRYCKDTVHISEEGIIEDGSGASDYAFNSDCKWFVTAPEGKIIDIKFLEFDTEAKTDLLYFFNGAGTHEKIMAIFSGPSIPPELSSWRHQVLIWFVTDDKTQAKGWKAKISFIDSKK